MSFSEIDNQLSNITQEIQEINQSIKGLVIQIQLITSSLEETLKSRQRKEYIPLETTSPTTVISGSNDEKHLKRY